MLRFVAVPVPQMIQVSRMSQFSRMSQVPWMSLFHRGFWSQRMSQAQKLVRSEGWVSINNKLFYYILFYLFSSILFYSFLFYSTPFYSILCYSILFYSILFYSILFYSILFYSALLYSILFYSILFYSNVESYTDSELNINFKMSLFQVRDLWVKQRLLLQQLGQLLRLGRGLWGGGESSDHCHLAEDSCISI